MSYSANDDGFERVDGFDDNPPPYSVTPADESRKQQEKVGLKMDYVKSKPGIIKIIMIILSLLGFIASVAGSWTGSGWVSWVTVSAFLCTSLLFIVHALNVYPRLPGFWPLYELIFLILYSLKYFLAVIFCIIGAAQGYSTGAAIFGLIVCLLALGVFVLETVWQYHRFKEAKEERERQMETGEGSANRRGGDSFCIIF